MPVMKYIWVTVLDGINKMIFYFFSLTFPLIYQNVTIQLPVIGRKYYGGTIESSKRIRSIKKVVYGLDPFFFELFDNVTCFGDSKYTLWRYFI